MSKIPGACKRQKVMLENSWKIPKQKDVKIDKLTFTTMFQGVKLNLNT